MKSASVTQLKNQLSAHLKTVIAGEPVLVTDRRRPIAVLQPLARDAWSEQLAGLVTAGVVSPPKQALRVKDFLKKPKARAAESLTAAVLEDRDGR